MASAVFDEAIRTGDDQPVPAWTVEVDSIEKMLTMARASGHPLIVSPSDHEFEGLPDIEVYDYWRE